MVMPCPWAEEPGGVRPQQEPRLQANAPAEQDDPADGRVDEPAYGPADGPVGDGSGQAGQEGAVADVAPPESRLGARALESTATARAVVHAAC